MKNEKMNLQLPWQLHMLGCLLFVMFVYWRKSFSCVMKILKYII